MLDVGKLSYSLKKTLPGNLEKNKWPVKVWKLTRRGEDWKWTHDRGRRTKNPETGDYEYQFLKENETTASISYDNIFTGPTGEDTLIVAKPEQGVYMPVKPELEITKDNEQDWGDLGEDDFDMDMFINMAHFIKVGKNELERHYEITKNESNSILDNFYIQMAAAFIGMGLFMMLTGIAINKTISGTAAASLLPLLKTRGDGLWR